MSKFGVLITGPAGAGKSTFCTALLTHLRANKRPSIYVNLDPAATDFAYAPDIDIRDLITLDDVMEEMDYGPNGGLIYCFEYLLDNLDFLTEPLESASEEYLVVIDMPGQIELYTHVPILPALVNHLRGGSLNMSLCAAYLLESTFVLDRAKFFAGTLSAMSAMLMLELPHVNILSKMDLIKNQISRRDMKRFVHAEPGLLDDDPDAPTDRTITLDDMPEDTPINASDHASIQTSDHTSSHANTHPSSSDPSNSQNLMQGRSFARLNRAVAGLIDDYSMVSFLRLDVQDEDSVAFIVSHIDDAIQYHEAQEPREPNDAVEVE